MLRKKLYVILSKGEATAEQIGAVLPQHLEYMIGLEKTGMLFASGPLSAPPGHSWAKWCDAAARNRALRLAQPFVPYISATFGQPWFAHQCRCRPSLRNWPPGWRIT